MVFDVDFGFVNVDVMLGLCVEKNLFYVFFGECIFDEVLVIGLYGIKIVFVILGM